MLSGHPPPIRTISPQRLCEELRENTVPLHHQGLPTNPENRPTAIENDLDLTHGTAVETVEVSVLHHDQGAVLLPETEIGFEIDTQSTTKKPTRQDTPLNAQERQKLTRRLNELEKNEKSLLVNLEDSSHRVLDTADETPGREIEVHVAAAAAAAIEIKIETEPETEIETDQRDIEAYPEEAEAEAEAKAEAAVAVAVPAAAPDHEETRKDPKTAPAQSTLIDTSPENPAGEEPTGAAGAGVGVGVGVDREVPDVIVTETGGEDLEARVVAELREIAEIEELTIVPGMSRGESGETGAGVGAGVAIEIEIEVNDERGTGRGREIIEEGTEVDESPLPLLLLLLLEKIRVHSPNPALHYHIGDTSQKPEREVNFLFFSCLCRIQ
jgi:hypothetical protein